MPLADLIMQRFLPTFVSSIASSHMKFFWQVLHLNAENHRLKFLLEVMQKLPKLWEVIGNWNCILLHCVSYILVKISHV